MVSLFAGGVPGAIVLDLGIEDPDRAWPLRDAARVARRASGQSRSPVLVIANETVGGDELREELLRRGPPRPELRVISTHPPGRSNWLERGLVERVRDQLDMPVPHVVVDLERQRVEIVRLPRQALDADVRRPPASTNVRIST